MSAFKNAFNNKDSISIIAEIKLASPTHTDLGSKTDIESRAISYEQAGANAISFITETSVFKGSVTQIPHLKSHVSIPVLQKDFVIDPYQIYEAKVIGSDAILLISRLLDESKLQDFVTLAQNIGVEPVVEIDNEHELGKALGTTTSIIAVNARDLGTFSIDVDRACKLLKKIPDKFIKLGFSGINSAEEVKKYKDAGANGVLVGTSLMKAKNISEFISSLKKV